MMTVFQSTKCSGCDEPLPEGFTKSCPKCGDNQSKMTARFAEVPHNLDHLLNETAQSAGSRIKKNSCTKPLILQHHPTHLTFP